MGRTLKVVISAEIADLKAKLREGGSAVRGFAGELDKAAKGGHLDAVAGPATRVGLALTGMAAYAVKSAADFEKSMSAVKAATTDSSKSVAENAAAVKQLRAAAIQAGKDTQYSATEAAQGITELAKAGVGTTDVLNGGLKGALALAAAGQMSVAEAAETSASALTQFKLSGRDLPHVADLLAAGAGKAQGSVHDMGQALNQSGLVAAQFGLSIEDTTGVLAEFANAGLVGSDAGTSLKTMLLALANPSKQTRTLMDDLGISFYDAQGKFVGFEGVAQILQTRLKGLTDAQRQQALGQIFGNDAIRSASVLYTDGAAGVQKWKSAVNDAGFASKTASTLTDNLAGDLERLKGSVETMAIESGSGANSGLRVMAKGLNELVDTFGKLPPEVGSTVTVLAGAIGVITLVGAGFIKARRQGALFRGELEAMGPGGARAAAGLSKVGSAAGKVGLAFAAVEVAGAAIGHFQADLNPQVEAMSVGLSQLAADGHTAGEASRVLGKDLNDLAVGFKFLADDSGRSKTVKTLQEGLEAVVPGLEGTNTSLAKTKERISAVDATLAQLVSSGNTGQASADFDALAKQLAVGDVSMDEFRRQFPQYAASLETAGSASKGAATKLGDLNSALDVGAAAQDKYKTHADAAAGAARGERAALGALFAEIKGQTDPVFALISAQRGLKEAQDAATKAIRQHGRGSKEARDADIDLAQRAIELQGATGNLSQSFDGKLSPALRSTLEAAGLTKTQIKGVESQFGSAKKAADRFAGRYAAEASAPGAKQAKKDLDLAYTSANGFAGPYVAHISVDGDKPVNAKLEALLIKQRQLATGLSYNGARGAVQKDMDTNRWANSFPKKADGGAISGPGTGTSDSILAWLSNGEHVWTAAEVAALGGQQAMLSLRAAVKSGKRVEIADEAPGFASGGAVWPFQVDVSKTKIPDPMMLGGAGPGGGQTDDWIVRAVMARFPALHYISKFRKGAMTLTGNRSLHSMHRAVDWPANYELALWWHNTFGARTKELITPWNELNIHNGKPHRYTGAVWNQHNFAGGNAHDHIAMKDGGPINEHIIGVGRSGRTYEFGEAGPEYVVPGYATGGLVNVAPGAAVASPTRGSRLDTADALLSAASAVGQLSAALKENGRSWSTATQKGRDNRSALISGVRAAQQAAKAKFEETGSIKAANRVYDDYLHQLDASMKKMKVNAATRRALLKAYGERPTYDLPDAPVRAPSNSAGRVGMVTDQIAVEQALTSAQSAFAWTKPTFNVKTATGQAELQQLFAFLSAAQAAAQSSYDYNGNAAGATQYYAGYLNQLRTILRASGLSNTRIDELFKAYGRITLTPKSNRWGGVYEHAAGGALRDAQIAPGGPTRYAWAEQETGGEAFIPKNGDRAKSLAIWQHVGTKWLGQTAGQGGGARHVTVQATIPIQLGAETITRQVRFEVDAALGKVVDAIVYQTA